MAEIDDNNESSAKQIGPTALGLKEVRVVLEPLDLERLSQSRSSYSSSFSASEVMGKFPSFNRRHSMGSSSRRRSPSDFPSTPSVSGYYRKTQMSSQGCNSQRSNRSLRLRTPPRVRVPLSQAIVISDSDDEFQKSKICRVNNKSKEHKKRVRETRRRKERDDSGDRENCRNTYLRRDRFRSRIRQATIKIKSESSSDEETGQRSFDNSSDAKIDLTMSPGGNVVDLTVESPEKALQEFVVFNRDKSTSQVDSELLKTTDSKEDVKFSEIQTATEMNESREIKKELIDDTKKEEEGTFFLNVNGVKCDGTKDLPVFEPLENGSVHKDLQKDEIEAALIKVGCEQEEHVIKDKHTTPLKTLYRIFDDDNSADSVKMKSCSKRLFGDKEPEEPRKGDLKFIYKLNQNGLVIKKRGRKKKSKIETEQKKEEEVEEKQDNKDRMSEIKNKENEKQESKLNDSAEDQGSDDVLSLSMPMLDCCDPLEPSSPTPRLLPKIIEVQKLDEPHLLDLNRLASPIPTPSRCQGNPDFDAEELYNMVSNEASLNDETELAGESLLPIEPATIPTNLDVVDIVEMMTQTETIEINEASLNENNVSHFSANAMENTDKFREKRLNVQKRKIEQEKGTFESDDKKFKLDQVDCSKLSSSNCHTYSSNRTGVKASKTLSLNGDCSRLWIHEASTQENEKFNIHEELTQVNENCNNEKKSRHVNDATLEKPKNNGTRINNDNDTDLDYSSYSSSSSSDEESEKKDEELESKEKENGGEKIDEDGETQDEDKESEAAKNAEQNDDESRDIEKEDDGKSQKKEEEDFDDCISIFYSDDDQLLKSPERKVSSKYQIPKPKGCPKPKPEPKPAVKCQTQRVKKVVPKLVIKQTGPEAKYECKQVKELKPDPPKGAGPKRKHSPIIFNRSKVTVSKINVKNSANVQTAPKIARFPPKNVHPVSRQVPLPKVTIPPNAFPALPNTYSVPPNPFVLQPNTFAVEPNVHHFPPPPYPVLQPAIMQPVAATTAYMLKDFDKDMAGTDCNGNQSLFSEPINLRESGQVSKCVFPPAHPTNEYRPPGFTKHCSVQQLMSTCSKDEVPLSFSPSKILKPQSDVKMRLGHTGLDKEKVFEKMCFQLLRIGKCTRGHCPYQHDLTSHREALVTRSRDYLFSVIQLVIDNRLEFYLRFIYTRFLEVLDYQDACEMFKLINSRNVVQTRAEVDAIMTTMLNKQNLSLSTVLLDLTRFAEDPQLKMVLFESANSRINRPGLFWDTFKDYFKESNAIPNKFNIDVIIEECVMLQKNCAHMTDVCQYFYHLKYDKNVPFDISGVYFDRFINLIRKHGLNSYLEVFNVQDEDVLSPASPNKVQVCVPPMVQDPRVHPETFKLIPITTTPNEEKGKADEQVQTDEKFVEWKVKLIEIECSEMKSAYHDMFGELHQDIFWLTRALKVHDYVKAIDILKKYALDLGKNPFYNTCYNKCLKAITQVGKKLVEQGQVEHEKEFWSFVKDLLDIRHRIEVQDYLAALIVFKKYARSSSDDMRHRFSYVSYLLIREEFTMVEKYFTMIELAVRGGTRDTLFAMLLDLGTRILLEIVDKGHWYNAYKLVKHLENVTCGASFTLLQAQIFLANQRPEKAFSMLKSTKLLYKDKKVWLVPPQEEDENLRVHVINALMKTLICNDVTTAFALFEILILDQKSVWQPINLSYHSNYLLLELALGHNVGTLVELCWLIMKYNILLEDSVSRIAVIMLTRHNIELGKVFFEFAANRGVYNILKNQRVSARVIKLILRSNTTEEEIYLIVSDMLEQLCLHCGQGITRITRSSFKVFFIFQRYPTAKKLYQNDSFDGIKDMREREEEYRNARKVLEKVLLTRFNPPIRLVNQMTGRFVQLQQTSVIDYLKNVIK